MVSKRMHGPGGRALRAMKSHSSADIAFVRIPGTISYAEMAAVQRARRDAVESATAPDTVYFLQHSPVITLGRDARPEHMLSDSATLQAEGIEVIETDRGGDLTYHGPGQIVAYPIFNLNHWRCSVGWYLRSLEEVVIQAIRPFGLQGERIPGYTGVWVNGFKVAAVGVAIRNWITWHGLALNVNPQMRHFSHIVPCGIRGKPVGSLQLLLGSAPSMDSVVTQMEIAFREVFASTR